MKHSKHLLSIDLEDWHTSAFLRHHLPAGKPISQIENSTAAILNLFERNEVQATFFVLGSVAREHPALIKQIAAAGHEIASHGYSHTPLWELTPAAFKTEVVDTSHILEDITGKQVKGFRAPYCSLDYSTAWMLAILEEEGFEYDSSMFPMRTAMYGVSNAPTGIYRIHAGNIGTHNPTAKLLEIPFTVYSAGGIKVPCTGGVYGRLLPMPILKFLLKSTATKRALNFYFHPWETYKHTPRIAAPLFNRFISYYNVSGYLDRVEALLKQFSFTSFEKFFQENSARF